MSSEHWRIYEAIQRARLEEGVGYFDHVDGELLRKYNMCYPIRGQYFVRAERLPTLLADARFKARLEDDSKIVDVVSTRLVESMYELIRIIIDGGKVEIPPESLIHTELKRRRIPVLRLTTKRRVSLGMLCYSEWHTEKTITEVILGQIEQRDKDLTYTVKND